MAKKDFASSLLKVPHLVEACFLVENSSMRRTCDGSCFQVSTSEISVVYSFSSCVSFPVSRRSLIYLTFILSAVT